MSKDHKTVSPIANICSIKICETISKGIGIFITFTALVHWNWQPDNKRGNLRRTRNVYS